MAELPEQRYLERELSWLDFNERVLDLARDKNRIALLERVKFLAIFSTNLDEFFMVRIAGLKRRLQAGLAVRSVTGKLPSELYADVLRRVSALATKQSDVFQSDIRPALKDAGIEILRWEELNAAEKATMHQVFAERIFPVLTPLAVDPSHPFPYISGLSLNLAILLRDPTTGAKQFARVKMPSSLPRLLQLSEGRFLLLEEVIARNLHRLFTGMEILDYTSFRVTRNEDIEVEEDEAENLLFALERELQLRKVGRPPVRLEVADTIAEAMLERLLGELAVREDEVFRLPVPLDLSGLFVLTETNREDLKYPSFLPSTHPDLAVVESASPAEFFDRLRKRDVLLQHPYDSFATSVQRFLEQAAADPAVLAIKQTLYRTSGDSPIIDALIAAAQAGKQVLAVVEIKARFDEQANIEWARKLEKAGVHVVYGMIGLKTHCKLSLVVRQEPRGLRRYCHIGTGNYNPKTARLYEDMGLLTSNPITTEDVAKLFNHLSGMTNEKHYRRLLVSPHGIRQGLLQRIDQEIANHANGLPAGIRIKVNSLVDEESIDAFYRASQAGVPIDLWVRGSCAIRPGVPGLSDNIRVRSILGRFLEHSRMYWFAGGGKPAVGIGSADLMLRNLDRRVEALVAITHPRHIRRIENCFDLAFAPEVAHWRLDDDTWTKCTVTERGEPLVDLQEKLIAQTAGIKTR